MIRSVAAIAAAAVLVLTGCVAIPDSGAVTEGVVDVSEQENGLVFLAQEPEEGATQEQIILGFLSAGISPDDDFSIAREFLTRDEAQRWQPDAGVIVRAGPPEVSFGSETQATAVVAALSEVDAGGALRRPGEDRMLEFEMLLQDGQWRIAAAPDGIVLSSFHFAELFRMHALHWMTPDATRSVPEVRWFERTATTLPSRIIDALLDGPSTWLSPAVVTSGAADASRVGEPRVDGTTMTVTVDATQIQQQGPGSLQALSQQLALSLRTVGVREVIVEISGRPDLSASSAASPPIDLGAVDPRPLVLDGASLRPIGAGASTIEDVGPTLSAIGATSYTVGAEGGVAHTGTTAVWIEAGADPVTISADAASVGTVDDSGWVLLQERSAPQRLLAWRDGERVELGLPPGTGRITAMELARDGSRLAIVTVDGDASQVLVAAIVRDAEGRPASLGEPYPLPLLDGVATDVTWSGPTQIAVLAAGGDQAQIATLVVGGDSEQLPQPGVPVQALVGGSEGTSTLRALGADGSLLSQRGRVWTAADGLGPISLIATQQ
ncbi:hypothetical protein ABIB37_000284 [Agrococcus sp. UYP10]|uniref:LpqB family beta-propeller domain-containing protein n=1 Tax=Agrococcus sp. UYP10 TaxID=1756355 RepID=UPI0033909333